MTKVTDDGLTADAQQWLTSALGTSEVTVRSARIRPWSGVWQVSAPGLDLCWFKENRGTALYEPVVTATLGSLGEVVAEPIAVEPGRGWLLMSDAGTVLRAALDAEPAATEGTRAIRAWRELLPRYADLQLASVPSVDALAAAGVPVLAPLDHPALFDDMLGDESWLRPGVSPEMPHEVYAQLCGAQAIVAEAADAVEALGLPLTIQHDDLHDNNVFVASADLTLPDIEFSVIDWGDCYVGMPFASLLVTLRGILNRLRLDGSTEPAELTPLTDAYLEPFTAPGRTLADLRATLPAALLLARLARAESWRRMFPGGAAAAAALGWEDAVPGWVASIVDGAWI